MKKRAFLILAGLILHVIIPIPDYAQALMEKKHDFLPQYQNVFFVIDTSKSMHAEWSDRSPSRLIMAAHALGMFNSVMPPVPLWQYSVSASLVTIGDPRGPGLLVPLQPWNPKLIEPHYKIFGYPSNYFSRISRLEDALQFCA
ncbi:MAG: hypothetical protein QG577_1574, partial [Thermodesulfobacteriota bacterium]|nr:hypothetical protein [Thermodesulfobacteriota bacterium]